ncbi:hypothetical protein GGX14DRAFT_565489 [Mycena pura]|uniref:Uncharacterized protein n=1 Tax=Mycena pura TaxID=153505 RepID=A0AAD6VEV9_9AGAR|nr:hypothetical protein GGX14DRAFT_565489 [Mycena pura]
MAPFLHSNPSVAVLNLVISLSVIQFSNTPQTTRTCPLPSPLLSPSSNMLFALKALLLAGLVAHSALAAPTVRFTKRHSESPTQATQPFPVNARALLPGDGRPLRARAQPDGNGTTVSRTVPSYQPALMITGAPQPADEVASAKALVDSGGALGDPALNGVLPARPLPPPGGGGGSGSGDLLDSLLSGLGILGVLGKSGGGEGGGLL